MTNTNGGAAFPHQAKDAGYPGYQPGLTIRDWFAGQALAGILSGRGPVMDRAFLAGIAYEFADGMLAKRKAQE